MNTGKAPPHPRTWPASASLHAKASPKRRSWQHVGVTLVALLLAIGLAGCTTGVNPVTGNTRAYGYTWEQEQELGTQADKQIQNQYGIYDDEQVQAYVDSLGQAILAHSHMRRADTPARFRNTEFTFRVLDSPIINAFALPGGYVYITRGLLAHQNNEAQLAMVIGHEIAHVAARHASQQAAKQQFAQLGLIAGAIGGELAGFSGGNILQLGGQAAQLLFLSYSRENEREADRLGVEYAALDGYQSGEGAAFFRTLERIQEQSGQSIPSWQSTHPDPGEREQTILRLAEEWRARTEMTKLQQASLYRRLGGVVLGDNPRQGFVQNDVFYHPDLRFQFPTPPSFSVTNQPRQVMMVAENQQAVLQFAIAQEETARAAAQQIASIEGATVVEQGPMRAGSLSGYSVVVDVPTQEGQVVRARQFSVPYDGNVYNFLGYALRDQFSTYRGPFLETMRGFASLSDPDILNVQPTRLVLQQVTQPAPFDRFVPSTLPESLSPQRLAILNQVGINQQMEPSRVLKLPGQ